MEVNFLRKNKKLQSTMEYLITYMWVFLIIAIALVSLFLLGVFTPQITQQCLLGNNLICENYIMNTNGILSISIVNTGSTPINVTGVACYTNQTYQYYQKPNTPSYQVYMPTGNGESFALQCYNGPQPFSSNIGGYISGDISVNYVNVLTGIAGSTTGRIIVKSTTGNTILISNYGVIFSDQVQITNNQNQQIQPNFQQMFSINPSSFALNGLNANMSNIEFTTSSRGTGIPIQAWIESGASNTATNAIIWLNLPSGITANGGTQTVYMNFINNNAPVTSGVTGYAPQLWCASGCFQTGYAQYDNGASVFSNYWNFAGTSTPSGWNTAETSSLSVSNSISFKGASSGAFSAQIVLMTTYSRPFVMDEYVAAFGTNPTVSLIYVNEYGSPFTNGYQSYQEYAGCCSGNQIYKRTNGGTTFTTGTSQSMPVTNNGISTLMVGSSTLTSMWNYGYDVSATDSAYNVYYPGIGCWWNDKGVVVQWFRIRTYPPNGAMPSISCSYGTCTN